MILYVKVCVSEQSVNASFHNKQTNYLKGAKKWTCVRHKIPDIFCKYFIKPKIGCCPVLSFKPRQNSKVLRRLVGNELFSTLQPLSPQVHRKPIYRYFHRKYSDELHSLGLLAQVVTAKTYHAMYTGVKQPHSLHIQLVSRKFHSNSFFPRTATLQNRLLRVCFLDHYNLKVQG